MSRVILVHLFFVGLAAAVVAATPPAPNPDALVNFKVSKARQIGVQSDIPYYFFTNINSLDWNAAKIQCENLGEGYHLVSVETQDKSALLLDFLTSEGEEYNEFWTSGTYDQTSRSLVWDNGLPIPTWAPWAINQPPAAPNTRVSYAVAYGLVSWKRTANTNRKQSVCEYVFDTVAAPCYRDADLIVLMDSSGSISQPDYQIGLQFASDLAGAWRTYTGTRMGWTIFSNGASRIFELTTALSQAQCQAMVRNTTYIGGGTATDSALDDALQEYSSSPRGVPRNVLTITDGYSNVPVNTIVSADRLKTGGYRMFAVGVGNYNYEELVTLAGGDASRVFTVTQFSEILNVLRPVCVRICQQ